MSETGNLEQLQNDLSKHEIDLKHTIENYCDAIGCRDCVLKEPDNSCHATQTQSIITNIEKKIMDLEDSASQQTN